MVRALACCGGADGINRALHLQHPCAALALLPTLALLPQRPRVSQLKRPTPAPRPARRPVRASCISLSLNPMGLLGRFCDARGLLKRGGGPVVGGRSEPPAAPWTAPYTPNARISPSDHPPYGTVAASAAPIGPRLAASPRAGPCAAPRPFSGGRHARPASPTAVCPSRGPFWPNPPSRPHCSTLATVCVRRWRGADRCCTHCSNTNGGKRRPRRNRSPRARIADPPIPSSFTTSTFFFVDPCWPRDPMCRLNVGDSA